MSWHQKHGSWWMIQWHQGLFWLSLGIHIDLKKRYVPKSDKYYGPYIDLHFLSIIISIGRNPYYSSAWEGVISVGRGGEII